MIWERKYQILFFIIAASLITSCITPYFPDLDEKYDRVMVVDGTITNQPGPYLIKLSYSTSVDDPVFSALSGYKVIIQNDEGLSEVLIENNPGLYTTRQGGIRGEIGKAYKLIIETPDEAIYETEFQELLEPVEIDVVYAELENQPTENPDASLWGYQFYLDTKQAKSDTNYFLWRMHATYEYHSDFLIKNYYDGQLHVFTNTDSLFYCWSDDEIISNLAQSTVGLSSPVIRSLPLFFVNTETRKLSVKYSLLVDQYTIDKHAFNYFYEIQNIGEQQGALYNTLPYQVKGNVKNINNINEPVLGYFTVGGIASKRIFVDPPPPNIPFYYSTCEISEGDFDAFKYIWFTDHRTWPLYITTDAYGNRALTPQACVNCTKKGGSLEKPAYWVD